MTPVRLSASRAIPAPVPVPFETVMAASLPEVLGRRYGVLPGVRETREQPSTWDCVGQTRRIVTADGGTMLERLTSVDPPRSFGYTLSEFTGLLRPLVASLDGLWSVAEAGTGCRVTWQWTIHPRGWLGALAVPVIGRFWPGYARQGLEELERLLVGRPG